MYPIDLLKLSWTLHRSVSTSSPRRPMVITLCSHLEKELSRRIWKTRSNLMFGKPIPYLHSFTIPTHPPHRPTLPRVLLHTGHTISLSKFSPWCILYIDHLLYLYYCYQDCHNTNPHQLRSWVLANAKQWQTNYLLRCLRSNDGFQWWVIKKTADQRLMKCFTSHNKLYNNGVWNDALVNSEEGAAIQLIWACVIWFTCEESEVSILFYVLKTWRKRFGNTIFHTTYTLYTDYRSKEQILERGEETGACGKERKRDSPPSIPVLLPTLTGPAAAAAAATAPLHRRERVKNARASPPNTERVPSSIWENKDIK